jgi:hypothetical protein
VQLEFVLHTAPAVHFFSIAKHCPLPCTADRRDVHALQRSALSEAELSEIRAIERVGHRRRKQWLNDKLLRDLAGPMSTQDMVSDFLWWWWWWWGVCVGGGGGGGRGGCKYSGQC